jgi:DNA-binding NarL/FixJ family response regulator
MGGMSGLDAIAPIKRLAPQTAVLMLTTLYGPDDRRRAIESGASDMLSKSFRVEEIVERARQAHEGLIQARANECQQANESVLPKAVHERLNCRSAKQSSDSALLRRFVNVIRQVRMAWAARLRRRQASVSVSS